jgi:uncharacterized protein YerC
MPNMDYCKFENTLAELRQCYDNFYDVQSVSEIKSRSELIELCKLIVVDCGYQVFKTEKM